MYDRKTWFVLLVCGVLLAMNFHFRSEAEKAKAADKDRQQKTEQDSNQYNQDATNRNTGNTTGTADLTVDTPPPSTERKLVTLETDEVTFTLSNIGGGIKHAEFTDEFQVGNDKEKVRSNRYGTGPIGAIADPSQQLANIAYTYKEDQSVPGKKVVYIAKLKSGLGVKKTYSLIEGDKPGTPYLLDYKLQIVNAGESVMNLGDWSIFLGEASPLYPKENPGQTGFFWHEDGSMHFKHGGKFKKGWFRSGKSIIESPSDETVAFAGVANQFFTTVIQPGEPAMTPVWGKSSQVVIEKGAKPDSSVRAGIRLPATQLQPGDETTLNYRIFIGPKQNTMLRRMNKDWGKGWGEDGFARIARRGGKKGKPGVCGIARSPSVALGGFMLESEGSTHLASVTGIDRGTVEQLKFTVMDNICIFMRWNLDGRCGQLSSWVDSHHAVLIGVIGVILGLVSLWPLSSDWRRRRRRRRLRNERRRASETEHSNGAVGTRTETSPLVSQADNNGGPPLYGTNEK